MILWHHTFARITEGQVPLPNDPPELDVFNEHYPQLVMPISHKPGYATAPITGTPSFANQVLLELHAPNWVAVGEYSGDTIHVVRRLWGTGLADELLVRCLLQRDLPLTTQFTERGFGLLRRVHRDQVRRAIEAGIGVPENVLEEYRNREHQN
jgi:hypothetical protein